MLVVLRCSEGTYDMVKLPADEAELHVSSGLPVDSIFASTDDGVLLRYASVDAFRVKATRTSPCTRACWTCFITRRPTAFRSPLEKGEVEAEARASGSPTRTPRKLAVVTRATGAPPPGGG